jgi:hypothetical protein
MRYMRGPAAVCALLCLAFGTGCGDGDSAGPGRPEVSVDDLLAQSEFAAQIWPNEGWELYDTVNLGLSGTDEAKRRSWEVSDYSGGLEQEIFKFDNTADARRNFRRDDPRSYDEDFPLRVDASEEFSSVSADESRVYCLGLQGSSEACSVWAHWARYGQYVMRLNYVAGLQDNSGNDTFVLQPGIGLDRFLGYVRAFDEHVSDALASSSPTPSRRAVNDLGSPRSS